jgi:hypothetical protein
VTFDPRLSAIVEHLEVVIQAAAAARRLVLEDLPDADTGPADDLPDLEPDQ